MSGRRAIRGEDGATAVEYALLIALIAGVIITIVITLGLSLNQLFANPAFNALTP